MGASLGARLEDVALHFPAQLFVPKSFPFAHHSYERGISTVSLWRFWELTWRSSSNLICCAIAIVEHVGSFCHVYSVGGFYSCYYYLEVCVASLLGVTVPVAVVYVVAG